MWVLTLIGGGALLGARPLSTNASELAAAEEATLSRSELPKDISPADLVGLTEQKAIQLLGPAKASESRAAAKIWHYQTANCELDLAFYMEMRTGLMRTLHYDFRRGAGTAASQQACLTAIEQQNSKGAPNDNSPGKNLMAESSTEKDIPATATETATQTHDVPLASNEKTSVENELPPALTPKPRASRREPYVHRSYARHHPRWYAARGGRWDFALAVRSYPGWSSRDAGLTTGWGGGRFGPAPYSASGP